MIRYRQSLSIPIPDFVMTLQLFSPATLPLAQAMWVLAPALATATAALLASPRHDTATAWRAARWATGAALGLAAALLVAAALGAHGAAYGQRADHLGAAMLLLVAFVGWVIVRYSQGYLQGESRERHYVRWLMATLASVFMVVATNNVLGLALAWMGTSLALHRLLTFFGERPAAIVAAHKKFIVARLADLCMAGAVCLLYQAFGTLQIDQTLLMATHSPALPLSARIATALIACTALLKCAQLPFHGWLIQVMEAPTPVSALLHAGIVNLGGFVLIRFAPLVSQVPASQVLLVVAGAATASLAALVMTTRISVKVMLAWSTCAQMGFMLVECGLGAWDMAFVHLLAHSLYKAHSFLGSGGTVQTSSVAKLSPRAAAPSWAGIGAGALVGLGMVLAAGVLWTALTPGLVAAPAMWVLAGIVGLALTPLIQVHAPRPGGFWLPAMGLTAFGIALIYFALHVLFGIWLQSPATSTITALWVVVAIIFAALFVVQSLVSVAPQSRLAQRLYPWFYGGLFLDGKFNGIAFRLWPPPVPAVTKASSLPGGNFMTLTSHPAAGASQ